MKVQLILLGAPGAGKGSQAARLVVEKGFKHISTGDLLRAEIQKGTEIGEKVKEIIERGELVDDSTVLKLLQTNCDLESNQYIFDGFPRNLEQAQALDLEVLRGAKTRAIYFEMDVEELTKRIVNRRIAPKSGEIYNLITRPPKVSGRCDISGEELIQRKDDNEETVRNRLEIFKSTIDPMLDYYKNLDILKRVDATLEQDKVFAQVLEVINN